MDFNLQWVIVIMIIGTFTFTGLYYFVKRRVLLKKHKNKEASESKFNLPEKKSSSTFKNELVETINTDVTTKVFNEELMKDELYYINPVVTVNDRDLFWYGYWFNVDQFLFMRMDNTFEWSMPNYVGKGQFKYTIMNKWKVKINLYFNNSQEREWIFQKINENTMEIESSTQYKGSKLKFIMYKDNSY